MLLRSGAALVLSLFASASLADTAKIADAALAFGARQSVEQVSLSPDGSRVAFIEPLAGMGSRLVTVDLANPTGRQIALVATGNPDRLSGCHWVSNERLVCRVFGIFSRPEGLLSASRIVAIDRNGANLKVLSKQGNEYTHGWLLGGGSVIDWLPEEDSAVLMSRLYLPDEHVGSHLGSSERGLGVDWLDTRDLHSRAIESPASGAVGYISDAHGTVRIMALRPIAGARGQEGKVILYRYRKPDSRDWQPLSEYDTSSRTGFEPIAVDHDLNVAYGFRREDGRVGVYSVALDGSLAEKLIYARPDVDIDELIRIGRNNRVVGVSYATAERVRVNTDANIDKIMKSLSRALPRQPQVSIVDANVDERLLLVYAGADDEPGEYFLLNRDSKELRRLLLVRNQLEGVTLAKMKPIEYPAADGQMIPGYLTLPPGKEDAKGLPAIVLPHGGPEARDEWGFDWLSQYFAARGFAVLQPNFRGSAGYGEAWLKENGFKSWRIAIGDVLDAGRWLVGQKIADPAKLCIFGWSYGGYAALQSAVVEPGLFKAVVAVAPVTDLEAAKEEWRDWSNYDEVSDFIGEGPHIQEGSPARNADRIKVPVLLFHGALDRNVSIAQSRLMAARLEKAGVKHELITWDALDHSLDDSTARAEMLRKSDAFMRQVIGISAPP